MIIRLGAVLIVLALMATVAQTGVDTLKGTSDIEDCYIYSYADCDPERPGEDCRRFNTGGLYRMRIGVYPSARDHRALLSIPGWEGSIPDSSKFLINCVYEFDGVDRKIFLYPLTKQIYEGTEVTSMLGDYPNPDSGATWYHAWLDVGDSDSLNWTTTGGDYNVGVACTTTITGTDQYFSFDHFNRVLNYWDTSSQDYGFILINENAFPANSAQKQILTTESSTGLSPMVLLFTTDFFEVVGARRRMIGQILSDG
ncbi:MAG: hypothetical protein KOO62_08545 [candidate division Zixibacteria bacterium]|nr:hypothetical protein [candidate division Zixibacteria bacterium]